MNPNDGAWTEVVAKGRKNKNRNTAEASSACVPPNVNHHGTTTAHSHHKGHHQQSGTIPSFYFSKEKFSELIKASVPQVAKEILNHLKLFLRAVESPSFCTRGMSLVLQVLLQVSKGLSLEPETMSNSIIILNEIFSSRCYYFQVQLKQFIAHMPASDSFKESDLNVICDLFHNLLEKIRGKYWTILPLETLFETVDIIPKCKRLRKEAQIKSTCILLREFYSEMKKRKMVANIKKYESDKGDHEWDNSDYRDIPIIPQWHEIDQAGAPSKLRPNIIDFGEYDDWMHYYDIQFRLLREDFIAPLRKGIAEYRAGKPGRNSYVRVYTDVSIGGYHFDRSGLCHTIKFNVSSFQKINWEHSKRLIHGSLLCLSPASDNFKHSAMFAIVIDRSEKELENGRVKVMFSNSSEVIVQKQNGKQFVMLESIALYEASSHILRSLQLADDTTMPFTQYLIKNSPTVGFPRYLKMASTNVVYDLRFIIKKDRLRNPKWAKKYSEVSVLNKMAWPPQEETILDESQLKAMKMALTQEVVMIQGPPGTGKTYMGLKIVQALLKNQDFWSPKERRKQHVKNGPPQIVEVRTGGPILIMCLTNHALDQFLEGILDLYKKSEAKPTLIRVGSRSKSDTLKLYSLKEAMKNQNVPYKERQEYKELKEQKSRIMKECKLQLAKYSDPINKFVEFSEIQIFISEHHIRSLKDNFCTPEERAMAMEIWLGLYVTDEYELLQPTEVDDVPSEEEYQPSSESSDDESEYSFARSTFDDSDTDSSRELSDLEEEQQERMLEGMKEMYTDNLADCSKPIQTIKKPKMTHKIKRVVKVVRCKDYRRFRNNKTRNLITTSRYNELEAEEIEDVNQLPLDDRWELYKLWHSKFRAGKLEALEQTCQKYHQACEDANRAQQNKQRFALENAQIIGMTTTGTAKYQHILHMVKPKIVIVEEAAEVMESHIVSSLNAGTQQLILIGDHKQLRPKPNDYDMVKNYNLDISLFERMVNKDFPYATLEIQHRMRPEIAQLVHPHIYKTLHNHESVLKYPKIDRISKNLYFISHNKPERVSSDQSHANEHEANYLIALCQFILQNCNYNPTQITILVTYTGQLLLIKNMIKSLPIMKGVRICTVDNFQGEENDIILLSLVRSNDDNSIGFLKEENRVCVSLSRARHAFYCIGNFEMLQRSTPSNIWLTIVQFMKDNGNLGNGLEVHCKNHPQEKYEILLPEEFEQKSPRGGCTLPCGKRLNCGHTCYQKCHLRDPNHLQIRCHKPCQKKCELGHDCKLECWEKCKCTELVEKEFPKCEHKQLVKCFKDISELKCDKKVKKEISGCGHIQEITCHKDPSLFKCQEKVVKVLRPCGHEQTVKCSENVYSVKCTELVLKALPFCNHSQYVMCHMNTLWVSCESNCDRMCPRNLHKCGKKCHRNSRCSPCMETVEEVLKCGHKQRIACSSNPESVKCMNDCEQECSRGHKCKQRCYEQCRRCMVEIEVQSEKCGHVNMVNCFEVERFVCTIRVPKKLKCGHVRIFPCPDDPDRVGCSVIVPLTLLKCRHTLEIYCWQELSQVKCQELIPKKLRCGHIQEDKCYLEVDEIICLKKSMRELECGHKHLLDCSADLNIIQCNKLCQKNLDCGHVVTVHCYKQTAKADCMEPCTITLPCNHSMTVPCNQVLKNHKCTQQCEKKLSCGHQCRNMCMKECSCSEIVLRYLPCGHTAEVRCQDNIMYYKCMESCKKILSCGHKCKSLCHEPCDTMCKERVTIACDQGHKRTVECSQQSDSRCMEKCARLMPCQHPCKKLCYERCTGTCRLLVKKKYPCGHVHRIPCSSPAEEHPCDYICRYPLSCGHPCNGECSKCFSTRIHEPCTSSVGLRHFCGEKVRLKCLGLRGKHPKSTAGEYLGNNIVCKHKEVPWKCLGSFDKCSNSCNWACSSLCPKPKEECRRLCSELCTRLPCDEPCIMMMKCGLHRCIGLCGERCISVCPTCEPRLFKSHLKRASEYSETERYVELQCGHIFTVAYMDNYALYREGDRKVLLLRCPVCSKPMSCSYRYGNAMKESLQDIKEVKKLMEKKSKGNKKSLIDLYYNAGQELTITKVKKLCPPQLFDIITNAMKKIFETDKIREEEEFLLFFIIKIYHLVGRLELSESATEILDSLLPWLNQQLDDFRLSFQISYDLLSEYYRLYLIVMTKDGKVGPTTILKQMDRINSDPHSRITSENFDEWSRQLDIHCAVDIRRDIDSFLPRIRNGVWMKCYSGHYYCIPVTHPDLQIHRVQCFECIGSYSASISIEISDDVQQTLQKSVDISEQREKAIRDEIKREQEEAAQGGEASGFRKGKSNSRKRKEKKNRN